MPTYPTTSMKQARSFLARVQESGQIPGSTDDYVSFKGSGAEDVEDALQGLEHDLRDYSGSEPVKPEFDAVAREVVHRNLVGLSDAVLADADFWRYLSCVRFYSLVARRHPPSAKSRAEDGIDGNWDNFGGKSSSVRESLMFRLFTGADLAYVPGEASDPYELCRIADVDLWQSHIVRVMSGDNPVYVRELLRWFRRRDEWYKSISDVDVATLFSSFDDSPKTRHLRDLVKRIRRLRSNVVHEFLSEGEVQDLVAEEARLSLDGIARWGRKRKSR